MSDQPVTVRSPFGWRYMLVPAWHTRRWDARSAYLELSEAMRDEWCARQLRALAQAGELRSQDDDAVARYLAEEVASGRIVLVSLPDEPTTGMRPVFRDPPLPADWSQVTPLSSLRESASFHAKVVMDDGGALANLEIALRPSGKPGLCTSTDDLGEVAVDGLVAGDTVGLSLARPDDPAVVPCWRGESDGFVASPHTSPFPFLGPVTFELPVGGTQRIVLQRPEVLRVDGESLGFAAESALLVPLEAARSHLVALAAAVAALPGTPARRLLVVGHASVDGDPSANAALALHRARGVRLLLTGDRDGWVALATQHGAPADIQRLLMYLASSHGWPCDPGRVDGVMDDAVAHAVAGFQQQYNDIYDGLIDVDGVVGAQTLGALFDTQSYELHEHVAALGGSTASLAWFDDVGIASAGADVLAHPAIPQSWGAAGQRRVDLLLTGPELTWTQDAGAPLLYRVARFGRVPVPPLAAGHRDLVVRVVDHYGRPLAHEPYVVATDVERREGTTDGAGILVELGLAGSLSRLECAGSPRAPVDLAYEDQCTPRLVRIAPTDLAEDDDEDEPEGDDEELDADVELMGELFPVDGDVPWPDAFDEDADDT